MFGMFEKLRVEGQSGPLDQFRIFSNIPNISNFVEIHHVLIPSNISKPVRQRMFEMFGMLEQLRVEGQPAPPPTMS